MKLIRIEKHPTDPDVVILRTPPDMAPDMGRFEAARYDADRRAYLTHSDTIPSLYRFAKHVGAHVTDDRTGLGERRLAHQCGHCAQAGSVANPPKFCPDCGEPWMPVTHHDVSPPVALTRCDGCGRMQRGRFPRCAHCGAGLNHAPGGKVVHLPRVKLADPVPLSVAIDETFPEIDRAKPETTETEEQGDERFRRV